MTTNLTSSFSYRLKRAYLREKSVLKKIRRGLCYFEISEQFTIENFLMIIFYDKTNVIIYIPFKMDFSFTSENTILSYNE